MQLKIYSSRANEKLPKMKYFHPAREWAQIERNEIQNLLLNISKNENQIASDREIFGQ